MAKDKKKVSVNKPLGGDTYLEFDGGKYASKDVRAKCLDAIEGIAAERDLSGVKVHSLDVYVLAAEGKAYFVAGTSAGEINGEVPLRD